MKLIARFWNMLAHPKGVFPIIKKEKVGEALLYLLLVLLLSTIPLLILSIFAINKYFVPAFPGAPAFIFWGAFLFSVITVPNIIIILWILLTVFVFWVIYRILRIQIAYGDLLKIFIYTFTPFLVAYWLVPISLSLLIWSVILFFKGLIIVEDVPTKITLRVFLTITFLAVVFGLVINLIV